ncbi:glycosyltransferase family 39 protein [Endozoicomonas sp. OPT23]|uniref:glycosyltransferase family 39 protein n=1 Tax=Endozoicomonas sp. OPT23 TaxID=2072845 RepID=UPI0018919557|nr:glycosyltransferase family 39 protein [Endozoicomonas sp. OPT23]
MKLDNKPATINMAFRVLNVWKENGYLLHIIIALSLLLNTVIAMNAPLMHYEAHYGLYGRFPALSYVDHPPMVGWLQYLALLFSKTDFALRIAPLLLVTASQYLIARIACRLFIDKTGWLGIVSVLLLQGTAIFRLTFTMSPELPFLLTGLLVFYSYLQILEHDRLKDWLLLGTCLGVAGLSKYTAVTLIPSVLLVLSLHFRLQLFFKPGLWLSALVAIVLITPVVIWNLEHDWASFAFQSSYQFNAKPDPFTGLSSAILQQVGAYSPLLFIATITAPRTLWQQGQQSAVIRALAFTLPIFLLFTVLSISGRSSSHWTLLAWVLSAPMAACWLLSQWSMNRVKVLTWFSGTLSILTIIASLLIIWPGNHLLFNKNPLAQLTGWPEASARAQTLYREYAPESMQGKAWIFVRNWHYGGLLGWYNSNLSIVNPEKQSAYQLWYGQPSVQSAGILVIAKRKAVEPNATLEGFQCKPVSQYLASRSDKVVNYFYFYYCTSYD